MPLVSRTFDQLISFTRTSAATYVNSAGNIVTTPASKNLLTFTEEFDNAAWTKTDTTVTANNALAPDGNFTADTLTEGSAGTGQVGATGSVPSAGATATYSIHLKRGNTDWVRIQVFNGANGFRAWFNLGTGAVGTSAAVGTGSLTGASIASAGDGWYRCILTGAIPSATAYSAFTNTASADNSSTRVSGGNYLAWGAQLETGSTATSYVRNFGGLFPPRFDYDPVTLQPRGLLIEEQRTNLLLRSEEFDAASWSKTRSSVTANATTSPDGTVDADKLVEDTTASNTHQVGQTFSAVSGTSYSFSVYLKASEKTWALLQLSSSMFADASSRSAYINLSTGAIGTTAGSPAVTVSSAGNGWWRVAIVASATATASAAALIYLATGNNGASYTGDGTSGIFVWGAQLEAAAFATSYIPTVASQVTRTADQASIVAPMFAPWYNQSEGTLVAEFSYLSAASSGASAICIDDGTSTNRHLVYKGSGTNSIILYRNAANDSLGSASANNALKVAFAYNSTNTLGSLNGGGVVTVSGSPPSGVNQLLIGRSSGLPVLNGHIRRISYYPSRLSNAQLQALSA